MHTDSKRLVVKAATTEAVTTEALTSTLENASAVSGPGQIDLQPFGP